MLFVSLLLLAGGCSSSTSSPPGEEVSPPGLRIEAQRPGRALQPSTSPLLGRSTPVDPAFPIETLPPLLSGRSLRFPARAALAPEGLIYVSDPLAGLVIGHDGSRRVFELEAAARPLGLAVLGELLLVGDDERDCVEAYDRRDATLRFSLGGGDGEVEMPNTIAVDPAGERIYVADSRANRVRIYDATGAALGVLDGGTDPFDFPVAVAVDEARIAVVDQGHHRVVLHDLQGQRLAVLGGLPPDNASSLQQLRGRLVRPQAVALLGERIAVLDSAFGTTQLFDPGGDSQGFVGGRGSCATCVELALDLVWDPTAEALIVVDPHRRRWVRQALEPRATP